MSTRVFWKGRGSTEVTWLHAIARESLIKGENCMELHEQARCADIRCETFICLAGYLVKGHTCVDTNECEHESHQCSDNAICMDTEGGELNGVRLILIGLN